MKLRILTAILLIPPVIYLIGWSPRWLFLVAVVAAVELCLYEFFKICLHSGFKPFPVLGYLTGGMACLAQVLGAGRPETPVVLLLLALLLLTLLVALVLRDDLKTYLGAAATTIFGVIYVGVALSLLIHLRFSPPGASVFGPTGSSHLTTGRNLVLFLFVVVWADDTFAYLVGRTLGRKLLFPSLSPRKTLEGSVAGFVGSLLAAWGYAALFWQTAGVTIVILLAALVALAGQIGDLVESALKRGANLKDSGSLLPGHGGLLDRLDSLLFSVPVLWLALAVMDLWQ